MESWCLAVYLSLYGVFDILNIVIVGRVSSPSNFQQQYYQMKLQYIKVQKRNQIYCCSTGYDDGTDHFFNSHDESNCINCTGYDDGTDHFVNSHNESNCINYTRFGIKFTMISHD